MDKDLRNKLALILIAVLASLKFVVVPLVDWQDAVSMDVSAVKKRLHKGQLAIEQKDALELESHTSLHAIDQARAGLFDIVSENQFKLDQQAWLEDLVAQHNVEVEEISWGGATPGESGVVIYPVNLTFSSDVDDFILLHATLESGQKHIRFENFDLSIKRHAEKRIGSVRGSMRLLMFGYQDGA